MAGAAPPRIVARLLAAVEKGPIARLQGEQLAHRALCTAAAKPRSQRPQSPQLEPPCAERAVRELLALQASDWAFLDSRKQAGDYPWQRSTGHAKSLLQAIDCAAPTDPRLRNLAPDLSLTPLLRP